MKNPNIDITKAGRSGIEDVTEQNDSEEEETTKTKTTFVITIFARHCHRFMNRLNMSSYLIKYATFLEESVSAGGHHHQYLQMLSEGGCGSRNGS